MSTIVKYRKGFYCPKCWSSRIDKTLIYTTEFNKKETKTSLKINISCFECGHSQQLT